MHSLEEALHSVADHRSALGKRYRLSALLVFVCTGMLCGCQSLQALTKWGKRQEQVLLRAMGLPCGIAPGYGTLHRLVSQVDVEAFEQAVFGWTQEALEQTGSSGLLKEWAVDGKVLRGSRQGGYRDCIC